MDSKDDNHADTKMRLERWTTKKGIKNDQRHDVSPLAFSYQALSFCRFSLCCWLSLTFLCYSTWSPVMARHCPHPHALFSLRPFNGNQRAGHAIAHPNNQDHLYTSFDNVLALDINFHSSNKASQTLARLGAGPNVDVYVEGTCVSRWWHTDE